MAKKHILLLFSDTGGGHRSAAEAVAEALNAYYSKQVTVEMVDFLKGYGGKAFDKFPDIYPTMTRMPGVWEMTYKLTDGTLRTRMLQTAAWWLRRVAIGKMLAEHPADLVVSLHHFGNTPILNTLDEMMTRPAFATVVTDLVSTHQIWFDTRADACLVPTRLAADEAIEAGFSPKKVAVTGFPVKEAFEPVSEAQRAKLKSNFGLSSDQPLVMLTGGGEGMGRMGRIARQLDKAGLNSTIMVLCGRNKELFDKLQSYRWRSNVVIQGFTHEMHKYLQAADVVITKAGAAAVSEAINTHTPIIFYDFLAGQEEGNVTYILENHGGYWCPTSAEVSHEVAKLLQHLQLKQQISDNLARIAMPHASEKIAHELIKLLVNKT